MSCTNFDTDEKERRISELSKQKLELTEKLIKLSNDLAQVIREREQKEKEMYSRYHYVSVYKTEPEKKKFKSLSKMKSQMLQSYNEKLKKKKD
jgi:hypothetical protein